MSILTFFRRASQRSCLYSCLFILSKTGNLRALQLSYYSKRYSLDSPSCDYWAIGGLWHLNDYHKYNLLSNMLKKNLNLELPTSSQRIFSKILAQVALQCIMWLKRVIGPYHQVTPGYRMISFTACGICIWGSCLHMRFFFFKSQKLQIKNQEKIQASWMRKGRGKYKLVDIRRVS